VGKKYNRRENKLEFEIKIKMMGKNLLKIFVVDYFGFDLPLYLCISVPGRTKRKR